MSGVWNWVVDLWQAAWGDASFFVFWGIVKVTVVLGAVLTTVPFVVLLERKVIAWIQVRPGPNRVGPWGLLQGFADGIKLFFKEDVVPRDADRVLFFLGPALTVIPALVALAIVPFGADLPSEWFGGRQFTLSIASFSVGILFLMAITSVGVYGITLAGWSSNSKYALLGSIRATAQMVSYEVSLGLSIVGVLFLSGTLNLNDFAPLQDGGFWRWYVWQQPLGFLLVLLAAFAENNRLPFDLAEAETELGAGFHTEYSSMKFALFFLAEYVSMIVMGGIVVTLFWGGYSSLLGFYIFKDIVDIPLLYTVETVLVFATKLICYMVFFMFIRATLPRLRYDQLMDLGWKVMLPLALANLMVTAACIAFVPRYYPVALFLAGVLLIAATDQILSKRVRRQKRYAVPGIEVHV